MIRSKKSQAEDLLEKVRSQYLEGGPVMEINDEQEVGPDENLPEASSPPFR
jgi:hypothetical protein